MVMLLLASVVMMMHAVPSAEAAGGRGQDEGVEAAADGLDQISWFWNFMVCPMTHCAFLPKLPFSFGLMYLVQVLSIFG